VLGGPEVVRCVFHSSSSTQTSMDLETYWSYRTLQSKQKSSIETSW
jgi:hypothetical protein